MNVDADRPSFPPEPVKSGSERAGPSDPGRGRRGRRTFVLGMLPAATLSLTAATGSRAAGFPAKTVRIMYPFAPGGGMEVVLRVICQRMAQSTGESFVVENRTGAGGAIAAQAAATAEPDGHTLFVGPTGIMTITPHLRKLSYESRDLVPIAKLSEFKGVVVVANDLPVKSVPDLIAWSKANPGKVTFATSGVGSQAHLNALVQQKAWGVQWTHVPYKGAAEAVSDLVGGRVSMSSDVTLLQYVKRGQARLLANVDSKRLADFPDVPAITELPVPEVNRAGTWFGAFAPKGTPAAVVDTLAAEFEKALRGDDVLEQMKPFAMSPAFMGPAPFAALVKEHYALYGDVIRQAGIQLQN